MHRHVDGSWRRGIVLALTFASIAGSLAACNTIAGAGQDVSSVGHAVTGTSDATKQAIPPTPSQ